MTNIESDKLTKGHVTTCKKIFREESWKRKSVIKSKYLEKGIAQEEDAITLLSLVKGKFFKKNDARIENKFITGEPDIYVGESIYKVWDGYDTKCSWSHDTFPFPDDKLDAKYEFQDHGYIALTGAEKWTTAYCLVNATASLVLQEQKGLWYKLGCPDENNSTFIEGCIEIEKNMIYDMPKFQKDNPGFDSYALKYITWEFDIPKEERVIEFTVERNQKVIDRIYERVKLCREFLNEFANKGKLVEA